MLWKLSDLLFFFFLRLTYLPLCRRGFTRKTWRLFTRLGFRYGNSYNPNVLQEKNDNSNKKVINNGHIGNHTLITHKYIFGASGTPASTWKDLNGNIEVYLSCRYSQESHICDNLKHQKGTWKYFLFLECRHWLATKYSN